MNLRIAKLISTIAHPVLLTILAVFLISYKAEGNLFYAMRWTLVGLFLAGLTSVFLLYGMKKGFISNFDVSVRKQRVIVYPFVIALALFFAAILYFFKGPQLLEFISISLVISLIILDFVNQKIKASIHVASVASLTLGLSVLYGGVFYLSLLLLPLVVWSRVVMKRHTPKETLVGAVCGIILTLITIYIVQLLMPYGY